MPGPLYDEFLKDSGDTIDGLTAIYKLNTYNESRITEIFNMITKKLIDESDFKPLKIISMICDVMFWRYRFFKPYLLLIKKIIQRYHIKRLERCSVVLYYYLSKEYDLKLEYRYSELFNTFNINDDFYDDISEEYTIFSSIIYDHVEMFISFTEREGFNRKLIKSFSLTPERYECLWFFSMKFTLLEFCCYHGAVKCFKFLRTEYHATITQKCLQYSFLSGAPDILNECLKYQKPDSKCMECAIVSHNIDFITFLMNEFRLKISLDWCYKYKNLTALYVYLENNAVHNRNAEEILHQIAWNQEIKFLNLLIMFKVNLNLVDHLGMTPLHYAAENDCMSIITTLFSHGAFVNIPNNNGEMALHYAAENDLNDCVDFLTTCGAYINVSDNNGKTPLFYAAENHAVKSAGILIKKGAEINILDKSGKSPLHYAAMYSRKEQEKLKNSSNIDNDISFINKVANLRKLHEPAESVKINLYKTNSLLLNGYYIDTNIFNESERKSIELTKLLISNGADVNARDIENRKTALHYAAERNCKNLVEFLISCGAEVNAKDKNGLSAIHYAASKKNKDLIDILISHGADVNSRDNNQITPLHISSYFNQGEITETLISHGADVNIRDIDKETPLHYAAKKGFVQIAKILLYNGAHVRPFNKTNRTPLMIAEFFDIKMKSLLYMFYCIRMLKSPFVKLRKLSI
ncbi:hypothetical protein TVAG_114470 [Trichomonas vaginalis G3]|uniref:DUF3447 domain-containing protein n=1 Tax=Trichomonas vaginalis (strain ATCC PRA-98 / G3) TaxID=412133 RepID=A2FAR6_TRIV3|nr:spectrin binding [Trichomonas vaginalis G3]EAX97995.1 hypothetical protein TVAG_114470 [Trichomonas vaginalis G3]KAI5521898.1 spectrin binding [Trichomonas vaginalis G3]|eukprot:XP_001310925.1 hypothetical protein [Trichomonas vaginalis G3]